MSDLASKPFTRKGNIKVELILCDELLFEIINENDFYYEFITVIVAQSFEGLATNLRVVGSTTASVLLFISFIEFINAYLEQM